MISEHIYAAELLEGAGYPLPIKSGTVTMDEGWSPHVQATLRLPLLDETRRELLDPRENRRVSLSLSSTPVAPSTGIARSIECDLGLRDRTIDWQAGEITLELASDEALLQDDVLLDDAPNTAALAYQSSLRALIDNVVLSRIGAVLEAGTADSTFYVLSDSTNLFVNPTAQTDLAGASSTGLTSLQRQVAAGVGPRGTLFRLNGSAGSSDSFFVVGGDTGAIRNGMQAGKTYTVRANCRLDAALGGSANSRARRIVVFTKVGAAAYVETASAQAPNTAGDHILTLTFTVPAGVTEAFIRFYHGHASTGIVYWHSLRLSEGTETDYFDGDSADTTDYGYAWTGTVGSSTSTRTALIERSPELLNWQPGESAWDFVQPLFQAAGLRLFCDEQRRWFLVDTTYTADGQTQIAYGSNLIRATDQISRDSEEWFDAALARYRWLDADGVQQERYDFYAEPGYTRVRTFELARAYPGPGFAEYAVRRAMGRGRQLEVEAVSLYTSRPTQPVVVTLPDTPIQTGVIARLTWQLDDDTMSIRTRGLTDTPPTAWIFLNAGVSWNASPVGGSWLAETIGA